jgi:hypothetical protein
VHKVLIQATLVTISSRRGWTHIAAVRAAWANNSAAGPIESVVDPSAISPADASRPVVPRATTFLERRLNLGVNFRVADNSGGIADSFPERDS